MAGAGVERGLATVHLIGVDSRGGGVTIRLATFNVENLFVRAKAMDTITWLEGQPALAAFEAFNRIAAKAIYTEQDKAALLQALEALRVLVRTPAGLRLARTTARRRRTDQMICRAEECGASGADVFAASLAGRPAPARPLDGWCKSMSAGSLWRASTCVAGLR